MANRIYKTNGTYIDQYGHNFDGTPRYVDVVMPMPSHSNYTDIPINQYSAVIPSVSQRAAQFAGPLAAAEAEYRNVYDAWLARQPRGLMSQPGGFLRDSNVYTPMSTQAGQALAGPRDAVMDFPVSISPMKR